MQHHICIQIGFHTGLFVREGWGGTQVEGISPPSSHNPLPEYISCAGQSSDQIAWGESGSFCAHVIGSQTHYYICKATTISKKHNTVLHSLCITQEHCVLSNLIALSVINTLFTKFDISDDIYLFVLLEYMVVISIINSHNFALPAIQNYSQDMNVLQMMLHIH